MSQYPPNPNYNPYGQNPSDPNYNQGTVYGGPPSGPGQNADPYNPYAGTAPAPDTNSNPYGPYGQNPPTPAPPPYNPPSSPNYNQYGTIPPVPSAPPAPPRRGPSMRIILIAAIALVLVIGGIAFALVSYNSAQQKNADATATAQSNATATAHANQTASAIAATATAIASNFPFSAKQVLNDPLSDNSKGNGWQTSDSTLCKFQGNAYHVLDSQANTFTFCLATKTDFTNFTYQVEAVLNSGDGLGIVFRGNDAKNQFYRIDIQTDGSYEVDVYVDTTGTNARTLTSGTLPSTPTLGNTNTIAVVARGSTMMFYFNQTEVTTITDPTYSHGQIGLESLDLKHSADAVFTNAQVWELS